MEIARPGSWPPLRVIHSLSACGLAEDCASKGEVTNRLASCRAVALSVAMVLPTTEIEAQQAKRPAMGLWSWSPASLLVGSTRPPVPLVVTVRRARSQKTGG